MDYKKIIKSRALRIKIMELFSFVPDRIAIKIQYKVKTGRKLNLIEPKRYTEKLQWYKLNYRDLLMGKCTDKYAVRDFVVDCGLGDTLVPIIGIYKSVEEIDFEKLPRQFVTKDTLGSGGNSVIVVKDKSQIDIESLKKTMRKWIKPKRGKHPGREWVYDDKKSRILIEQFINSNPNEGGLIDYKFFCFYGKVEYVYGINDRELGQQACLGIFDREFNLLSYKRADESALKRILKKPTNYEKMIEYAEILSSKFPHARIDLYNQDSKIMFGEITFFDGSGYMKFEPDEFDYILGKSFSLPKKER